MGESVVAHPEGEGVDRVGKQAGELTSGVGMPHRVGENLECQQHRGVVDGSRKLVGDRAGKIISRGEVQICAGRPVFGLPGGSCAGPLVAAQHPLAGEGEEQFALGAEVRIDRTLGVPGRGCDVADLGSLESLCREHPPGRVQQVRPGPVHPLAPALRAMRCARRTHPFHAG